MKLFNMLMRLCKLSATLTVVAVIFSPGMAMAWETIAHRGVYHDVADNRALPENSYYAVTRAKDLGLKGVELDLRLSSDLDVMVTHDWIANRTTRDDAWGGWFNPISGVTPNSIWINSKNSRHWRNTLLKVYASNGDLNTSNIHDWDPASYMQSLWSMFQMLNDHRWDVTHDHNFKIILDIQNPVLLEKAAGIVKQYGLQDYVYLKFFVKHGIYNSLQYNGSDTCYVYAKENNLTGLKIIPQVNSGELDWGGISAFRTWLTVSSYMQCWADAQAQHWDAAKLEMVSASVAPNDSNSWNGAWETINWGKQHGRRTMSILPNPDIGHWNGTYCQAYTFRTDSVHLADFSDSARGAKQTFINQSYPDYVVVDIMGDINNRSWSSDVGFYRSHLCWWL